jgi:hypothetical protein
VLAWLRSASTRSVFGARLVCSPALPQITSDERGFVRYCIVFCFCARIGKGSGFDEKSGRVTGAALCLVDLRQFCARAVKRETGVNPVRSRHCDKEVVAIYVTGMCSGGLLQAFCLFWCV